MSDQLFETPRTVAHQAPLSMGFSRQEYWSGLPFHSPGSLPDPGIEPMSPALQADSLPLSQGGSPDGPHPLGWLLSKQRENDKCWPVVKMWRNQNLCAMLVGVHSINVHVQTLWETVCWFLTKLNLELPYDPAIQLLDIYPKDLKTDLNRYLYTHVHSSFIHNNQKGVNKPSVYRQMNG